MLPRDSQGPFLSLCFLLEASCAKGLFDPLDWAKWSEKSRATARKKKIAAVSYLGLRTSTLTTPRSKLIYGPSAP